MKDPRIKHQKPWSLDRLRESLLMVNIPAFAPCDYERVVSVSVAFLLRAVDRKRERKERK